MVQESGNHRIARLSQSVLAPLTISIDRHQDKWSWKRNLKWIGVCLGVLALPPGGLESLGVAVAYAQVPAPPIYLAQANFEELDDEDYWENLCRLLARTADTEDAFADALAACEQAIDLEPKESRLWATHSSILVEAEQYPQAIASANQALMFNEANSLALANECRAYAALGENETALDKCNAALRVNGDWGHQSPAVAWRFRGIILGQDNEYEQSLVAYDRTLLLEPEDSLTLLYRCQALVNLERYQESLIDCQNALQGNERWGPENPGLAWYYQGFAHRSLADEQVQLGEMERAIAYYQDAIAHYDQAVRLTPDYVSSWTEQGWVLERLKRPIEALTSYNRAVALEPTSSRALLGQCTMLNQTEEYETALAACENAIKGDGQWWQRGAAQAWNQQSYALAGLGRYEEALASANRAVGIDPNFAMAWSDRSVILWYLEEYDQALTSVKNALRLNLELAQAWANQGRIQRSLGQIKSEWDWNVATLHYEQALESYHQALHLQPDNAEFWANQSVVHWFLGDYENALSHANQAIHFAPTSIQAFQNRGAALVALNRYHEALHSYERATELDDKNADAWASLGVILIQLNQLESGQEALEQALTLNPQQSLALRALELIEP